MACSLCVSAPGMLRSGSEARAASRSTTMWSSAAWSDWSIQSRLPDMWQALRVTSTRWLTDSRSAVALRNNEKKTCFFYFLPLVASIDGGTRAFLSSSPWLDKTKRSRPLSGSGTANPSRQWALAWSFPAHPKAPLKWWQNKCDYLASRRMGSRGGYMDLTTSSTLWDGPASGSVSGSASAEPQTSCFLLPGADAFGHCDDVTQAGWSFDLCTWAHCHGNQFFSQRVANLCVENQQIRPETDVSEQEHWLFYIIWQFTRVDQPGPNKLKGILGISSLNNIFQS